VIIVKNVLIPLAKYKGMCYTVTVNAVKKSAYSKCALSREGQLAEKSLMQRILLFALERNS